MNSISEVSARLPFWEDLTAEEKELVSEKACLQTYRAGTYLYRAGESDSLGLLLILSGEIRAYVLSEEGREVTLYRLYRDDVCVLPTSDSVRKVAFDTFYVAERDCEAVVLGMPHLVQLTRDNVNVRCYMYQLMAERHASVIRTFRQILFVSFDRRLAAFLLEESGRIGVPEIHMTHEQIARYLGSAREVVARMLKRFVSEGLVEMSRGCIHVTDPDRLRQIAQPHNRTE